MSSYYNIVDDRTIIKNNFFIKDNRFLTSYYNLRSIDQKIQKNNSIKSTHEYKLFLQKNSISLINKERALLNNIAKLDIIKRTNNVNHSNDINYINKLKY